MEIPKYHLFEAKFLSAPNGNPFDVNFAASITQPDGSQRLVPGFYNGENEFVFRFMPEMEGKYRYVTKSPVPELDGHTGDFLCIKAEPNQHGRVQVQDQYWFSHADGTAYFDAGTTCYAWVHQAQPLREQTLATLEQGYFSKLRFCVFPKWYEQNHRQPELYPFEGDLDSGFDYDRPNVIFFRHLDACVARLHEMNIQADIILFHPYEADNWRFNFMTAEQDRRYLRYVIARLSAYSNVWWSLANEYDLIRTGYKKKTAAWKKLIAFVRKQDPYGHLTSIHQFTRMYDHRDPNLTHCSIQRTELFLTAEYTDTWREKYKKPVVIDECVYEGDLNPYWGGITAQELVRRAWEAAARGGYMGHSEAYAGENIWWSHGGILQGESQERFRFLREVMAGCPNIHFSSESGTNSTARAIAGADAQLVYFGFYQPIRYSLHLLGTAAYQVKIIDTWNMTIEELPEPVLESVEVSLPRKPYMAVLCTATTPGKSEAFTRDSVFEEMKLTAGGQKLLRFFRKVVPQYYAGMLTLTINQCSTAAGGILDGRAGDGILRIVNQNQFWRGLWQMLTGVILKK